MNGRLPTYHLRLAAAALLLASCASPPPTAPLGAPTPATPEPSEGGSPSAPTSNKPSPQAFQIPDTWQAASETTPGAPTAWLASFDAPALTDAVERAFAHNPDLASAAARLDRAVAEARVAGADRLPQASLGLDGRRQRISTFGPQSVGGVRFNDFGLDLNTNWELDLWGKLRDQKSAALGRIQASEAEFRGARLSLAARVAQAWFNLAEARQQLALSRRTAEADAENRRTIESRFDRGLSDGLDLRRIRAQAAGSRAEVVQRRRTLDRTRRSLEILLGAYPESGITGRAELPDPPEALPAGLPSGLLARRPDLVAAERRLAAAEKDLDAARKERLPQFSLTASAGRSSQEFRNLLDNNFSVWSLGANLAQPVFQGGRIAGNIDRAEALARQAAADYRATVLQAFFEVEAALAAEAYWRDQYAEVERAATEAYAAERTAWERYRNGTVDFLTALDARRTASQAGARAITLRNQILQNRVDLYLALGGPAAPREGERPREPDTDFNAEQPSPQRDATPPTHSQTTPPPAASS